MAYTSILSFGFNCELSYFLSKENLLTPTIFSWADVRGTDSLLSYFANPEHLFSDSFRRYSNNMFFCENLKIGFHGRYDFNKIEGVDEADHEALIKESFRELRERIIYLGHKTDEILSNQRTLIIVKWVNDIFDERYTPKESAAALQKILLRKYGANFELVYVFEKSSGFDSWDKEGYHGRVITKFASRSSAPEFSYTDWKKALSGFIL